MRISTQNNEEPKTKSKTKIVRYIMSEVKRMCKTGAKIALSIIVSVGLN